MKPVSIVTVGGLLSSVYILGYLLASATRKLSKERRASSWRLSVALLVVDGIASLSLPNQRFTRGESWKADVEALACDESEGQFASLRHAINEVIPGGLVLALEDFCDAFVGSAGLWAFVGVAFFAGSTWWRSGYLSTELIGRLTLLALPVVWIAQLGFGQRLGWRIAIHLMRAPVTVLATVSLLIGVTLSGVSYSVSLVLPSTPSNLGMDIEILIVSVCVLNVLASLVQPLPNDARSRIALISGLAIGVTATAPFSLPTLNLFGVAALAILMAMMPAGAAGGACASVELARRGDQELSTRFVKAVTEQHASELAYLSAIEAFDKLDRPDLAIESLRAASELEPDKDSYFFGLLELLAGEPFTVEDHYRVRYHVSGFAPNSRTLFLDDFLGLDD